MKNGEHSLNTKTVDLFSPADRFMAASKMYVRLHRWWLLFRRYWWLVAFICLAAPGLMYFYTVRTGPVFESHARMWVTGKINVSENWGYMEQLVDYLGTQAELLQSPALQRRALARLQNESRATTADGDKSTPFPFGVKVEQGTKSSTLDLRATGGDPAITRKYLDCLMSEYLLFKKEASDNASTQAAASLNAEAAQLKTELAAAQTQLEDFQASNNVVFLQQQGSSAQSYLATLDRQLARLRTELKLLDSLNPEQWLEADAIQAAANSDQPGDASARQMLANLQQSQSALFQADQHMRLLMAQRDQLAPFLQPAHPKIIKLNKEIADQQELVQVSRDEAAKQLALRHQTLNLQITNLEAASSEWSSKAVAASRRMAEYSQIQQKVQRLQAAYDKTLGLIQNIDVARRVEQADVGILDPASLAQPTRRLLIHMAFAAAGSFALCFGLLYLLALFQDNFASRAELSEQFPEPVIGQIPSISMRMTGKRLQIERLNRPGYHQFVEAFRNIRSSLLYPRNNGGTRPKALMIASSVPGEGKSTVTLYLAAILAKGGSRVLVIDADMRRPNLHKYFQLPIGPGLAELLEGQISSAEAIRPTTLTNVWTVPAGDAGQNPGDLVLSPAWVSFLTTVKSQFDFVLVDTPPVTATEDAAALAPMADGILFVVRALTTSARIVRAALGELRLRHAHVVGLIFNRAKSSPCERQYYQPYADSYHWPEKNRISGGGDKLLPNPAGTAHLAGEQV